MLFLLLFGVMDSYEVGFGCEFYGFGLLSVLALPLFYLLFALFPFLPATLLQRHHISLILPLKERPFLC
jgi:hypothetical protein